MSDVSWSTLTVLAEMRPLPTLEVFLPGRRRQNSVFIKFSEEVYLKRTLNGYWWTRYFPWTQFAAARRMIRDVSLRPRAFWEETSTFGKKNPLCGFVTGSDLYPWRMRTRMTPLLVGVCVTRDCGDGKLDVLQSHTHTHLRVVVFISVLKPRPFPPTLSAVISNGFTEDGRKSPTVSGWSVTSPRDLLED